ncbi:ATP-binding cassette domain-containing protein [Baia soyae]|uniref:ABC transporter family protein n=1 Tax=Baia soyae TaxID=1544746 RepID=A0A4R2S3W5_9BACL|nr:ATP-binding cassette domain-containing protein [Baia soyae]TCP70734.1 ABC transporter family protein [Baia soyae]
MQLIDEILDYEERDVDSGKPVNEVKGAIVLERVSFSYEKDRGKLNKMDMKIDSGQFIGIVGPSGESLPDKWDTIIGERGVRISGGEKQRIGIARALLQNPKILLMDEPTSVLDAQTEQLLSQYLLDFFQGGTVIVVAHRLSSIQDADWIFVVNEGRVAEKGVHDELIKKKGIYSGLVLDQQLKENL